MVEYQVMLNSSAVAQQIARGLASSGVTEVVIAPGSRSAPLIYALAPLAEAGVIRTHVRIDERDAGFLALGLARGLRSKQAGGAGGTDSGRGTGAGAVVLVTTSGSAVANLHPAVLEASYGHLPLIAITADRPARLRGTGANQTIDDQSQVLSDVRARVDVPAGSADAGHLLAEAVAKSLGSDSSEAGPVQFNVQFDVPLVPTVTELSQWKTEAHTLAASEPGEKRGTKESSGTGRTGETSGSVHSAPVSEKAPGAPDMPDMPDALDMTGAPDAARSVSVRILPGTVIVAGDAGGHCAQALKSLAETYAIPVLAEPSSRLTSELRNSRAAVPAHARVLSEREDLRTMIRTVIVHGKPTLTRPVAALLADPEVVVQRLPDEVDAVSLSVSFSQSESMTSPEPLTTSESLTEPESYSRSEGTAASIDTAWREDPAWRDEWVSAGELIVATSRQERGAEPVQSTARAITEHLAGRAINLFAASSNTIRYLSEATDVRARIHASRGLAGIDGLISTATGLSLALDEQVVLVIGDVAMLHDVGGLLTPSAEEAGNVLIVVFNDDGGAIFSGLEHSQDHVAPYLERYFTVPHGRDFRDLARAYGWEYSTVGLHSESRHVNEKSNQLHNFIAEFERVVDGADGGTEQDKSETTTLGRRIIEVNLT